MQRTNGVGPTQVHEVDASAGNEDGRNQGQEKLPYLIGNLK